MKESHDTIVLAWDETGDLKFCKTFDYMGNDAHKEEAQTAYDFVSKTYPLYVMGDVELILNRKNFIDNGL
jgi:hypothetical protein